MRIRFTVGSVRGVEVGPTVAVAGHLASSFPLGEDHRLRRAWRMAMQASDGECKRPLHKASGVGGTGCVAGGGVHTSGGNLGRARRMSQRSADGERQEPLQMAIGVGSAGIIGRDNIGRAVRVGTSWPYCCVVSAHAGQTRSVEEGVMGRHTASAEAATSRSQASQRATTPAYSCVCRRGGSSARESAFARRDLWDPHDNLR